MSEPDHELAERHASGIVGTGSPPDDENLARAYLNLAARIKVVEGYCDSLRPRARIADFFRKLLVERCGEEFVASEEWEEEFQQAIELEHLRFDHMLSLKAGRKAE